MRDLNEVIEAMYTSVCFEAGERPDWKLESEIFAPNARMVRVNDGGIFEFNLDQYRTDFDRMIDSGEMPSFWEGEIWRESHVFDNVAHVLSAYETRRHKSAPTMNKGVNSIQLFCKDGHWRICAMIWRREGAHISIPDQPPTPVSASH